MPGKIAPFSTIRRKAHRMFSQFSLKNGPALVRLPILGTPIFLSLSGFVNQPVVGNNPKNGWSNNDARKSRHASDRKFADLLRQLP
jgi:hypothetical protein